MRFVATKTLDQQSYLMLHRTRHLFIRPQTAVINAIRGPPAEFGIVAPVGRNGVEHLLNISSPIAVTDGYPAGLRSVVCGLSQVHEPTDHCLVRLSSGRNGIKPMQTTKPRKITVCRVQRKPVLHSQCSQVSV
jgi:hypothetical protein